MLQMLVLLLTIHWVFCPAWITVHSILSILYKPRNGPVKARNVYFTVVTVASSRVRESLYYVLNGLKRFNCDVYVVTDEGAELLNDLKKTFPNYHFVIVPESFRCKAIAKGRAIEWFIRTEVKPDCWYVFLDDDSLPLDDKFLYEIPSREVEGYVAANGILYPRPGRNVYAYILDHFRFLGDLIFFRAYQGTLKRPVCGFHGELLIVKGSVLREIGFNRRSLTEDFSFAIELLKRGYKTWHSQTRVSIKSPNSLGDFIRQRARWFKGNLMDLKSAPLTMKVVIGLHLYIAYLGFTGSLAFTMLWLMLSLYFGVGITPFIPTILVGAAYWIIGIFILPETSLKHKLLTLPVLVVGAVYPLYALRIKDFVVIDKN